VLPRSETVPTPSPSQTPILFVEDVIICAVLAVLSAVPIPCSQLGKPDAPLRVRRSSRHTAYRQDRVSPVRPPVFLRIIAVTFDLKDYPFLLRDEPIEQWLEHHARHAPRRSRASRSGACGANR